MGVLSTRPMSRRKHTNICLEVLQYIHTDGRILYLANWSKCRLFALLTHGLERRAGLASYTHSSVRRLFVLHISVKGCSFAHTHDAAGNISLLRFRLHSSGQMKHGAAEGVINK